MKRRRYRSVRSGAREQLSKLARLLFGVLLAALPATGPVLAQTASGVLSLLGQVRDGDQTRETEAPMDVYGDLSLTGLRHGSSLDTFFRLERDFGTSDGDTDFYAGSLRVPGAVPGVDATLGRQFLSEGPGGVFVADGGKARIDPGWPVAFTVFGGAPRYFSPTYGPDIISQDETIFGGSIRAARWAGGELSLGYLQQERADREVRQLVSATGSRSFHRLPGTPRLYSSVAYDADYQNLDLATGGADVFLRSVGVLFNLEGTYYRPQDEKGFVKDINRREDAIFQLFAFDAMTQLHSGLRYVWSPSLSLFGDYSFQTFEEREGDAEDGHVGNAGLLWLPGGDGLESVRVEYYVLDSGGGNVNGGRAYYENRIYERLELRTKLDVGYYEKASNQNAAMVASRVGLGYEFLPGLVCELSMEANHNDRFDEDFRFGFLVDYNFRHRLPWPGRDRGAS